MEPVVVTRLCMGNNYPEGYTDTKGRFSFQVGGDMTMLTSDASVSGGQAGRGFGSAGGAYNDDCVRQVGLGRFDLSSSTLRAELSGYRSDDVQLGFYSSMGNNDVGVIVLHRLDGLVGNAVSVLTLQAPKKAQNAYFSGLRELGKKTPNYKKSVAQFEKATQAYPQFAAAWAAMGDALVGLQDAEGARWAFEKAIEADPDYLKPYEPLIQMAVKESDWPNLEYLGGAYLKLNPNAGNVQFLTAVAALNTGKSEVAEEMVAKIRAGTDAARFLQTYQIMGMIHEKRAEFQKAAYEYREFIKASGQTQSTNVQSIQRKLKEWTMLGVIEAASLGVPSISSTAGAVSWALRLRPAPSHGRRCRVRAPRSR